MVEYISHIECPHTHWTHTIVIIFHSHMSENWKLQSFPTKKNYGFVQWGKCIDMLDDGFNVIYILENTLQ